MKKEDVKNDDTDDDSTDTQPIHGSVLGGFTSIRAASVRASGLAARNAALEITKSFDGSMLRGFTSIRAASVRASGLAARNVALERTKTFGGSMLGGFTCIRAASVRASGLAARNAYLERTKSNSCSMISDNVPQVLTSGEDGASVNKGSLKLDSDLKKRHEEHAQQQQQKVQTQLTPNPNRPTFWTVCPFCGIKYEYYKEWVNKPLICKSCNTRLTGFEADGHTKYSGTSSKGSQKTESVMKKRHEEHAQQQQKVQTQPTPNPNRPTFWTVCPFCGVKYECYKELVNKPLICKSCNKRFTGFEAESPANYFSTSSKDSEKTKVFENVRLESSLETLFTSQANKKPKRCDNIQNTGHQSEQNLRLSSFFRQEVSYDDYMSDDEFGQPSKKAKFTEEDDVHPDDDEIIDHDGVGPTTPLGGHCDVHDPDFYYFDSERTMEKFKVGQIWALYCDEDTLPKYYGIITKINTPPNSGLQMTWLSNMKSEDIIPWVDAQMPVTCGKFKVSRKTSQKYDDPGPFSHEVKARPSKKKGVYHILPRKGDVWALYKGWNKNMSYEDLQISEYEIVEVIETDYKSSITVLILEHVKGYKSVFKPQKGGESEELTMQIPWSEMLRFSHQILAVRLSEEKEGTLRGFWELDTAALPVYHFL